jgi:hypothetical protein
VTLGEQWSEYGVNDVADDRKMEHADQSTVFYPSQGLFPGKVCPPYLPRDFYRTPLPCLKPTLISLSTLVKKLIIFGPLLEGSIAGEGLGIPLLSLSFHPGAIKSLRFSKS